MKNLSKNPVSAYLIGAFDEFSKITWPTKEQAAMLTGITIVVSAFFVVLIGLVDLGFSQAYRALLDLLP